MSDTSLPEALPHPLFPTREPDEVARHEFLMDLKELVVRDVKPRIGARYAAVLEPAFRGARGRSPTGRAEVRKLIEQDAAWRWYSALARAQHEIYVDATAECVERQAVELRDRCSAAAERARQAAGGRLHGTLTLDSAVRIPAYHADIDVHCVPGGYAVELMSDDVYAAARYELGISLYTLGRHGTLNDSKGLAGVAFVRERFADLRPRRILDLGCTCGNSTLPWAQAFPTAEVHGLDVAAPALRYAHARAEALGVNVHFRQADAEAPPYPDGHFDLVVSHILLHETSQQSVQRIFAACHRLLAPGGVMLHVEVPVRNADLAPLEQVLVDWDSDNNNEVFWRGLHDMDLAAAACDAGFARERLFDLFYDAGHRAFSNARPWWLFGAQRGSAA
jgi:ubiquinone/menaquinone biosynthesis C-methylase UbiE